MEKNNLEEGKEALNRIKLLMGYKNSKTLNENLTEQGLGSVAKNTATGAATGAGIGAVAGGVGAIPGALVGGLIGLTSTFIGTGRQDAAKALFAGCKTLESTPTQTPEALDDLADTLHTAIDGIQTDEEAIRTTFLNIKTIPDLCALVKAYEVYGDLFDDLDGEFEQDSDWGDYVSAPLRTAVRTSEKISKETQNKKSEGTTEWPDCVRGYESIKDKQGNEVKQDPDDTSIIFYKNGRFYNTKTNKMGNYQC